MLGRYFSRILAVHVGAVALSGGLFALRAVLRVAGCEAANHIALRFASYLIDTTLLAAAILLMLIIHQYPLVDAWLTMKAALLAAYVMLGSIALKRARTRTGRIAA
ncbi:MAG: SirB2 family protein, partial [Steroidobacteraceae bacterium]|nr:SirB2 family protein [Steroidobacteraceae bacterium]